jgi:hypothetical protein
MEPQGATSSTRRRGACSGGGVDEFLARCDADELDLDDEDVLDLVTLIPFARR